jgi:hypothetical protein
MKHLLWLLLTGCALSSEPRYVDTTLVLPLGQTVRVTAPELATHLDAVAVAPGGADNILSRGSSGARAEIQGLPFRTQDTLVASVGAASPGSAPPWERPPFTVLLFGSRGYIVLESGTTWGEGGLGGVEGMVRQWVTHLSDGEAGTPQQAGKGFAGAGAGGAFGAPAQHGLIRLRFYTR